MKNASLYLVLIHFLCVQCTNEQKTETELEVTKVPAELIGLFEDDYQIQYSITDSTFTLLPSSIYHVDKWMIEDQYLIAQNDSSNTYDPGLWTRIDWIELKDMDPYNWAFCLTVFNAISAEEAEKNARVNREVPLEGCNGFPFSRMKRIEKADMKVDSY